MEEGEKKKHLTLQTVWQDWFIGKLNTAQVLKLTHKLKRDLSKREQFYGKADKRSFLMLSVFVKVVKLCTAESQRDKYVAAPIKELP